MDVERVSCFYPQRAMPAEVKLKSNRAGNLLPAQDAIIHARVKLTGSLETDKVDPNDMCFNEFVCTQSTNECTIDICRN